jgi:hypothetical protein
MWQKEVMYVCDEKSKNDCACFQHTRECALECYPIQEEVAWIRLVTGDGRWYRSLPKFIRRT